MLVAIYIGFSTIADMENKITEEVFDALLYISRLSTTEEEKQKLIPQIQKIVADMEILRTYTTGTEKEATIKSQDELRSNSIRKGLDSRDLKKNSKEYLDGYFRVPKVLDEN